MCSNFWILAYENLQWLLIQIEAKDAGKGMHVNASPEELMCLINCL